MEGRVFVCSWKETRSGYRVWVKNRPRLAAAGETFAEADEALYEAVMEATGDGENQHEYDPPSPEKSDALGDALRSRLTEISGASWAWVVNLGEIYTEGFCSLCWAGLGERTSAPAVLESIESGIDGGSAMMIRKPQGSGPRIEFFSAEFLALLTASERARIEWRRAERRRGGKKVYFELVGGRACYPYVAMKQSFCDTTLVRCPECGTENDPAYVFWPDPPSQYIAERDLPKRLASCFVLGQRQQRSLGFKPKRWSQLVGQPGTRGLRSSDVGVLAERLVERNPVRRLLERRDTVA